MTRPPRRPGCTYCTQSATLYRLYGPGAPNRANRAVPVCGSVDCAQRADRATYNAGRGHLYGHAPLGTKPL